jgi:alkylation response protein AidB-like acyl-CoA dehydrogenase
MDALLTPELKELRARARALADEVLAPRAEAADREERFPAEQMKALADAGFLAMLVPAERGGNGHGPIGYALAMSEMARACASTSVTMAVTNMVADAVHAWGSDGQIETHVPAIASGRYLAGAFALSEPGSGSDAASLQATAVRDGDAYVLNGNKCWITSGDHAGLVLVMAKTDPDAKARGISTFLVDPTADGFSVGRHEDKMGLRGSTTVTINLEDVRVPLSARLGDEGIGFKVAMRALDGGRIGIAAQAIGIAQGAFDEAVRLLGRCPEALVVAAAELEAARAMVLRASWLKAESRPFSREASMAKLFSTEAANRICQTAHAAVAEAGGVPTATLDRAVRDVRVTTIYEGTSEIQRIVIARKLFEALPA